MRRFRIPVAEAVIILRRLVNDARRQFRAHRAVENQNMGIFLGQHAGGLLHRQTDFRTAFYGNEFRLIFNDQFPQRFHGKRRVALVVHDHVLDRTPHNPAHGVDFLNRHFLDVHAWPGSGRGDHTDVTDYERLTFRLGRRDGRHADCNRNQQYQCRHRNHLNPVCLFHHATPSSFKKTK
jgi:hypothetical protein